MVPTRLFLAAVLLQAQTLPPEASQYCCSLEYWNPDNRCCSSCLWRFGPPCPDQEFSTNCGYNDVGDMETYPFKKCPPGQCNPDREELCRPCGTGTPALTLARSCNRTQQRCKERPIGINRCSATRILNHPNHSSSYEPSLPATDSLSWTTNSNISPPNFVLPLVLVPLLLVTFSVILLALWRHRLPKGEATANTGSVHGRPNTYGLSWPFSTGTLVLSGVGSTGVAHSLQRHVSRELPNLASQPLSCLLEELEVLEELILLLDPEPGPGGSGTCGTTRHLAARYGLPATWSTFAYSLRPSRSPLRALIETVVAREPGASLGQFGSYLAQIGRADALQVLSRLTGPTLFNKNENFV
ncbi:IGF-like family receptor 1 [Ochotona princeps]|uniref:IGF-like family receptor 1 n=1 Tax=Ochotona princeps TaxID=9978 RepID=UPI00271493C5|nr:IGF-like family receptor 1 [Ochotona princeps]